MSAAAPTRVVETVVQDALATITLSRPEAMNAITIELGEQLHEVLESLGERDDVNVIAIRGAAGNFCAGGDFREVQRLQDGGPEALRPLFEEFGHACRAIATITQPVVAVVEGVAMAGGFELMQACDLALVHDDAKLCDNHINFGQIPGGGGSQRLARLVGRNRALGHLLTGDRIRGRDAVTWGLAHRSFNAEEFEQGTGDVLTTMAARRPDALRTIKKLVRAGLDLDLDDALNLELEAVITHIAGAAGRAGVSAFDTARPGPATSADNSAASSSTVSAANRASRPTQGDT